jgi:chromosome partitioning protein
MPIVSTFCKKGGVGKTTFIGYMAHYYATQGNTVLVLSADDQNSIFKIFGAEKFIYERDDNYFEHLFTSQIEPKDAVCEARINMYIIKTLNTDRLSMSLTLERPQERRLRSIIKDFSERFDYVFIDFPPSSSRLTEILLDLSDKILVVVGLDTLGLDGYINTVQYFTDAEIDLNKISYIVPTGYHPIKIAPNEALKKLTEQVKIYTPNAKIVSPISEKSVIKNLQSEGISVFDKHQMSSDFHQKNRDAVEKELTSVFQEIKV